MTPMIHFPTLVLAQDAPGLAGQPVAPTTAPAATTGAPGSPAAKPQPQGMDGSILFMMLAAFGVIIVMQIFGSRKERKKRDALLGALKKNDRVQTAGGVIGAIVEVKPETVVLKVDENSNTRITFAKSAIVAVLNAAEGDKAEAKA
jgi:preprotein translocase subunit YajC